MIIYYIIREKSWKNNKKRNFYKSYKYSGYTRALVVNNTQSDVAYMWIIKWKTGKNQVKPRFLFIKYTQKTFSAGQYSPFCVICLWKHIKHVVCDIINPYSDPWNRIFLCTSYKNGGFSKLDK